MVFVPEVETPEAPDGNPSGRAGDIVERNGSGREVVDYRTLIEQIPAITYTEVHGGAGQRITYVSPQATHILGFTPQQFIEDGQLWRTLRHPADRASVAAAERTAEIWIRVFPQGGGVLVCVDDEGPGIPDELKASIFEPFRKGEAGTPGSGIGLSLVSRFAEFHGGHAWVQDRPECGAAFRVFLPGTLGGHGEGSPGPAGSPSQSEIADCP